MSRFIIGIAAIALCAGVAGAQYGPVPPSGWGYDCDNWIVYDTPWASGRLCYDPSYPGGDGWINCATGAQVIWPGLNIELWVEMECVLTWDHTQVRIHRASDYGDFYLYFHGTSACNHGQWIITTAPYDPGNLDFLPFVSRVAGSAQGTDTDIPLIWEYRIDGGNYQLMVDGDDGAKQFVVPLCDHNFDIRVFVDMIHHQGDGYYWLGGPGASICPASPM